MKMMTKIKTKGESNLNDITGSTYDLQEDRHIDGNIKKNRPQNVEYKLACLTRYLAAKSIHVNGSEQSPRISEK